MTIRVNSEMVRLARESRGYTQSQVSEATGIDQGAISRLEIGSGELLKEKMLLLADFLEYPISFFHQEERYAGLGLSVVFYRKKASALVKHMKRLEAEVNIRRIHAKALLRDVTLGLPNDFRAIDIEELDGDAEAIAQMTRANWKVSPGPIQNLVALIESAGGVVFRIPFGTRDIDALSVWPEDSAPLFFVNSEADADRCRFSLAHELGHMVMHRQVSESMEHEANRFASEFLMPKKDVQHLMYGMSLERASALKPHWRVSIGAIVRRSHDLGCMSEHRYSSLYSYMSKLGFRRKEPCPLPVEEPRLIRKLVDAHVEQKGFSLADLSRLLHASESDVKDKYLKSDGQLRLAL